MSSTLVAGFLPPVGGGNQAHRLTLSLVYSIGVDIGGTTIKAGLVGPDGAVGRYETRPTSPSDPDRIVADVVDLVQQIRGGDQLSVGVAVAAFLDTTRRTVLLSPNIDWENRPLGTELEHHLGSPVVLENDANAAGFAEWRVGAAKGSTTTVMFTLGTGVGGAVIDRGQLLVGARGMAGELGHLIVDDSGAICGCGQRGCVETVASATGMLRQLREERGDHSLQIADVEPLLNAEPELADQLFGRAATGMARAILQVHAVVDPDVIVLGGGIIERAGDRLVALIDQALTREAGSRRSPLAEIRPAQCGNQAGVIGAALLAASR